MPFRAVKPTARPRERARFERRGARFSKVDLKRALDGAKKVGLSIASVEIRPDGTIRIRTTDAEGANSADTLFDQWQDAL